jgi:hypothetical protein
MIIILNKMLLSLNQKLSLVTVLILSIFKCMNCDCGPPGKPSKGIILNDPEIKSRFPENYTIQYNCGGEVIIYNHRRICRDGKWTERIPKCGIY